MSDLTDSTVTIVLTPSQRIAAALRILFNVNQFQIAPDAKAELQAHIDAVMGAEHVDITDIGAEMTALNERANTLEADFNTLDGDIIALQDRVTALEAANETIAKSLEALEPTPAPQPAAPAPAPAADPAAPAPPVAVISTDSAHGASVVTPVIVTDHPTNGTTLVTPIMPDPTTGEVVIPAAGDVTVDPATGVPAAVQDGQPAATLGATIAIVDPTVPTAAEHAATNPADIVTAPAADTTQV
jgi:hypothetical protein